MCTGFAMRLPVSAIVLFLAAYAISCSTIQPPPQWPNQPPCLDNAPFGSVLKELEDATDINNTPGAQTELVRAVCDKRIYARGKYRIVIFRPPAMSSVGWATIHDRIEGFAGPNRPEVSQAAAVQCLAQAAADLERLGIERDLLDIYHRENPELWSDSDVGPARYLNCSEGRDAVYYRSLAVMVHEVTHQLTSDSGRCLFLGYPPSQTCFSIPPNLPSASIAILKDFPTQNRDELERLGKTQDLYLVDFPKLNKGPLFLFNELNAYTAGNETMTAIARHDGIDKLYQDGDRESEMLPLFALWVAHYLAEMHRRDPDFYSETLAAQTDDGERIRALLVRAEASYGAWTAELRRGGKREKEPEHNLWQAYLNQKKLVTN